MTYLHDLLFVLCAGLLGAGALVLVGKAVAQ